MTPVHAVIDSDLESMANATKLMARFVCGRSRPYRGELSEELKPKLQPRRVSLYTGRYSAPSAKVGRPPASGEIWQRESDRILNRV